MNGNVSLRRCDNGTAAHTLHFIIIFGGSYISVLSGQVFFLQRLLLRMAFLGELFMTLTL